MDLRMQKQMLALLNIDKNVSTVYCNIYVPSISTHVMIMILRM